MIKGTKRFKLSIYLVKDTYKLDTDIVSNLSSMIHYPISDDIGNFGNLYIKTSYKSVPVWADFFESIFDPKKINLENKSARAVLILNIDKRKFCLTFGHAHFLINKLAIQRNFGLRVALNIGQESGIKALDKTNLNITGIQTKAQSNQLLGINGFEYDFETDILKSMTALDEAGSQTFSGRDSISVGANVSLESLREYLKDIYVKYESDAYKSKFEWVDNIYEERDVDIIDKLDAQLVEDINNKVNFISLAIPEVIDWHDISGFTYKKSKVPAVLQDISLEVWLSEIIKNEKVELKFLKNKLVNVYDINSTLHKSWSIYQCLNAEIDLNGEKYILNDRVWYCINHKFVKNIKDFYQRIPVSNINLPNSGRRKEPEYNKFVESVHPTSVQSLDFDLVSVGGGKNKIEFCDLFTTDNKIIHVKKYGGSSILSHLFQQGIISGELFLSDSDFRTKVNCKLKSDFKLKNPSKRPDPTKYEICYAIMSNSDGELHIPFFSMVVLKNAVRRLETFGYRVTKLKIEQ